MREIIDPYWRTVCYTDTGEPVHPDVLAKGVTETCKERSVGEGVTSKVFRYFVAS